MDKKINNSDNESRNLEKTYYKGNMDTKAFIEQYMAKRREFHKYQILKVKVNQS